MIRRLIEARLARARVLAESLVDAVDDRGQLLLAELAVERRRLLTLTVIAVAAFFVGLIAVVWVAATVVALAWDTEWRQTVLLAVMAFWLLLALLLGLRARTLLSAGENAFEYTRRVAAEDLERLRQRLRS